MTPNFDAAQARIQIPAHLDFETYEQGSCYLAVREYLLKHTRSLENKQVLRAEMRAIRDKMEFLLSNVEFAGRRTGIDFSRHALEAVKIGSGKFETVIHELKIPNSRHNCITYISTCGVLTVTGDFGNWVFCREFVPTPDEGVSDSYWDEKLRIASEQLSHKYDTDKTLECIDEFVATYEDSYGEPMSEEVNDWVEELRSNADDKINYEHVAYREWRPSGIDHESVPYGEARHSWLNVVYDGFDEICARLKEEAEK